MPETVLLEMELTHEEKTLAGALCVDEKLVVDPLHKDDEYRLATYDKDDSESLQTPRLRCTTRNWVSPDWSETSASWRD